MSLVPLPHLEVITIEQPNSSILKTRTRDVNFPLSVENRALIEAMKGKLFELAGVGLAAPQVQSNQRIIAVHISEESASLRDEGQPYNMHIMINPTYQGAPGSNLVHDFEACFSVTSKAGKVPRFHTILLAYQDEEGTVHKKTVSGFYARVLQHEIDHLDGTLIIDRLTSECVQGSLSEMMTLRRNELAPEKRERLDAIVLQQKQLKQK